MRAVLEAHGVTDRTVWVADSFEGLPISRGALPEGRSMAVSLEEVQDNFLRFGLLAGQVRFLKGWFKDTLPKAPIKRLALLRLDGDLCESQMDALLALYDRVSPGGYVVDDDYYYYPPCARAIDDFRAHRGIDAPLVRVAWNTAYWQKALPAAGSATR